jgi:hypothetical protein
MKAHETKLLFSVIHLKTHLKFSEKHSSTTPVDMRDTFILCTRTVDMHDTLTDHKNLKYLNVRMAHTTLSRIMSFGIQQAITRRASDHIPNVLHRNKS